MQELETTQMTTTEQDTQQKRNFLALRKLHQKIHFNNQLKFKWAVLGGTAALILFVLVLQLMTKDVSVYLWLSLYAIISVGMGAFYVLKIKKHSDALQRRFESIDAIISDTVMTEEEQKKLIAIFEKNELHYASSSECETALALLHKINVVSYDDKTVISDALATKANQEDKLKNTLKDQKQIEKKLSAAIEHKMSLEAEIAELETYKEKQINTQASLDKEQREYNVMGADAVYDDLKQTYQTKITTLEKEYETLKRTIAAQEDELKRNQKDKEKIVNEQKSRVKTIEKLALEISAKQKKTQEAIDKKQQEVVKVTKNFDESTKEEAKLSINFSQEKDEYKKEKIGQKLETEKLYKEELLGKKRALEKEHRTLIDEEETTRLKNDALLQQKQDEEAVLTTKDTKDIAKIDSIMSEITTKKQDTITKQETLKKELEQQKNEAQEKIAPFEKVRKTIANLKVDLKIANEKLQQIPAKKSEVKTVSETIANKQHDLSDNRDVENGLKVEIEALDNTIKTLRGW